MSGASMRRCEPSVEVENLVRAVLDAALAVHRVLGPGFLESVYERALCVELTKRDIPFRTQMPVELDYCGVQIGDARLDLLIDGCLLVELKAVEGLLPIHQAQVLSYLRAIKQPLGLIINFNVRFLMQGVRRVIDTKNLR